MLRSEIYPLEQLIGELLKRSEYETTGRNTPPLKSAHQLRAVLSLCANLKKKWTEEIFRSTKEQIISRYIHFHQAGITQLSNQISRAIAAYGPSIERSASLQQYYGQVLDELEELLYFLRHQSYAYFDYDYKITIHNCSRQCEKMDSLRGEIMAYSGVEIDASLLAVINVSIREMAAEAWQSGISYRQTTHTLNLLHMIHQLIYGNQVATTAELAQALYRQNLNTLHFLNWYQDRLLFRFSQLSGKTEWETFINQQIKELSTVYVDPKKAFEPELLSIDQALLRWLREKTENQATDRYLLRQATIPVRLALNLSVPQFALFIRIFYQVGCFPDTNISKINRFFSRHFSTKKQSDISLKSFARAFYNLDQAAAAIVRDYLQKMLNYLDKTYFP